MKLNERYDGSDNSFEGDYTLLWRSLPANARVTTAIVRLTPQQSPVGELFEERISFTNGQGNWGATKVVGSNFVEVDLHKRRTLTAVMGATTGANLQVDLGGGAYIEINDKGAIKAPDDTLFPVPADGKLPALMVTKFKLTATSATATPFNLKPNISQVTIRSVPTNVSVRIGNLPPFWTHLGELTGEAVSPDFAAILQVFLNDAKTENGFYNLPVILHSDTIARLQVTLEIDYQIETSVMPEGLNEIQLPYDFSTLPKARDNVLQIAVPPNMRIAANGVTARVRGAFEETRIVYGATGAVKPAGTVDITPALSQAQMITLPKTLKATAIDLFMVVTQAATLQLDLLDDLDGKPARVSLLPTPVKLTLSAPVGIAQTNKTKGEPRWVSVVLPAEFQFQQHQHYWLVLQSLDGQAAWNVAPAVAGVAGMQHTKDSGLSWRDTIVAGISGAATAFFRLRQTPAQFETPIEFQVGEGEHAVRVNLNRFQPLGRVDFALDFEEISAAFNQYLDKVSPTSACPETEHLANGDFEKWYRSGETLSLQHTINLDFNPAAIAIHPDGTRAYAVGDKNEAGYLHVIDVLCNQTMGDILDLPISSVNGIVLSPDGRRAYVYDNSQLLIIDTATATALGNPLLLRFNINTLALSPDGSRLYVAEYFFNSTNPRGAIRVIDTTQLEHAVINGNSNLAAVIIDLGFGQEPTALAVSPDGSRLYIIIANTTGAGIHVFDTSRLQQLGTPLLVGQQHDAIALTPDGKRLVVTNAKAISLIDTRLGVVVGADIPLGGAPKAVVISPDSSRAYVVIALNDKFFLRVIDLTRNKVITPITKISLQSAKLALTPQGDKIYVANYVANEALQSISCVQIGDRLPVEWNVSGWVTPFCLPNPCHLIAVLGLTAKERDQKNSSALSQVMPVVNACVYEFSFWGIATEPDTAIAEVLWINKACGKLRTDKIAIQALDSQQQGRMVKSTALLRAANTDSNPQLILHRIHLTAPIDAEQAEVRFSVPSGVIAGIDRVSLMATNETVANADLSLQQDSRIADWTLVPSPSPSVLLIAGADGIQLRNASAETVELIQTLAIKGNTPFVLEFQGTAITRSTANVNPRIELRWLNADKSTAGSATVLEIPPTNVGSTMANGTSPIDATHAEIHVVVSGGITLAIKRISLRFSTPTLVPVTFIAQSFGELTVSDFKVALEQAKVTPPPIPTNGLCSSTLSRLSGESSGTSCFCLCCETEQIMTETTTMETQAGRPALVGRCVNCGGNLVRFGGQRVPNAQAFSLLEQGVSKPLVIQSIAMTTRQQLENEVSTPATILLTAINGINEANVQQLMMIGIDSIEKLATATVEDVTKVLDGVSVEKANEFIERAKQLAVEKI